MLDLRLEAAIAAGDVERHDVIDAMADAGTVDLRGQEDLALLLDALGPTAPVGSDPRAQEMRDRLAAWLATATHRRDRDHDGAYDDPQAPAIMDAWWPRLVHAMFDAASGDAVNSLAITIEDTDRTNHLGSAFNNGMYGHVNKDLRRVLGQPVLDPWSRAYCGNGVLAACRAALWASLDQAATDLETEFASATVANWRRALDYEDIRHTAVGVTTVPAIHWINRPTFQQVVQIGADTDPFKCYRARTAAGTVYNRASVALTDELGSTMSIARRPDAVCNAAAVEAQVRMDPTARLACYRIKAAAGEPRFTARDVMVSNRFGDAPLTLFKAWSVCVASVNDGVSAAQPLDHFKCYRARTPVGASRFTRRTVSVVDDFETKSTVVRKPHSLCLPVDKNGEGIVDRSDRLACYQIKDAPQQPRFTARTVGVANSIGNHTVAATKTTTLCVPSTVVVP
jgi:hypothetical protein